MTIRQQIVHDYFEGFRRSDHAAILACLTVDAPRVQRPFLSTISHRGPPVAPASVI